MYFKSCAISRWQYPVGLWEQVAHALAGSPAGESHAILKKKLKMLDYYIPSTNRVELFHCIFPGIFLQTPLPQKLWLLSMDYVSTRLIQILSRINPGRR